MVEPAPQDIEVLKGCRINPNAALLLGPHASGVIYDESPIFTGSLPYFRSPNFELKLLLLVP